MKTGDAKISFYNKTAFVRDYKRHEVTYEYDMQYNIINANVTAEPIVMRT